MYVGYDVAQEIVGEHYHNTIAVTTEQIVAQYLSLADDDDVVDAYAALLGVNGIACLSVGTKCEEETLHACVLLGQGHVTEVVE